MMKSFLIFLSLATLPLANASTVLPTEYVRLDELQTLGANKDFNTRFISEVLAMFDLDLTYRIGDEWGKTPVTDVTVYSEPLQKVIKATARVGGGTGFYMGKFNGRHIMGTNNHVCPSASRCAGSAARFTTLGKSFLVSKWLGAFKEVDFALIEIEVTDAADEALLLENAIPFDWHTDYQRGQALATVGYGVAGNPSRLAVINIDNDCRVYSGTADYRFMGDPDELNTGPDKVWSFANGCDVSHGDSGSAMVDRETGKNLGIIWTGRIPKNMKVQNSIYLTQMFEQNSEEIWQELSYGVPATKIFDRVYKHALQPTTDFETMETLLSVLNLTRSAPVPPDQNPTLN